MTKYSTKFVSEASIKIEDVCNHYSIASIKDLKKIIPDQVKNKDDLFPIAFNAFVANIANKNGDCIGTDDTLACYSSFLHKQINLEHDRSSIIGHVVNVALSNYSENYTKGEGSEIIQPSDVIGKNDPFNVCLAGVIYNIVAPHIIEVIEDGENEDSAKYLSFSASWEIGFDDFYLMVGSKYLNKATIIEDKKEISEISMRNLFSGNVKTDDGKPIYRLIKGNIVPLGIGLTISPAASVCGIVTDKQELQEYEENEEGELKKSVKNQALQTIKTIVSFQDLLSTIDLKKLEKIQSAIESQNINNKDLKNINKINNNNKKNISQENKDDVKETKTMKTFANYDEILNLNEESAKEYSFANFRKILQDKVEFLVTEYQNKIKNEELAKKEAIEKFEAAIKQIEALRMELEAIKAAQAQAEAEKIFQDRMTCLDNVFELDNEDKELIVADIKGLDDAAFEIWYKKFEKFAASKKKKAKKEEKTIKEKTEASEEDVSEVLRVLASIQEKNAAIANSIQGEETLKTKYAKAFCKDNIQIK